MFLLAIEVYARSVCTTEQTVLTPAQNVHQQLICNAAGDDAYDN